MDAEPHGTEDEPEGMRRKPKSRRPERPSDHRNRALAAIFLTVAFAFIVCVASRGIPSYGLSKVVDLTSLRLEVADTDATRTLGLSGRESLDSDAGMLFRFDSPGIYPFWMKDMKFPLDMVWIADGKVVDVVTLRPPVPTELIPPSHIPVAKANLVLELNAGKAADLGLVKGMYVILPR